MKCCTGASGLKPKWLRTMPTNSIQVAPRDMPLKDSFPSQRPMVMTTAKSRMEYAVPLTIRS